MYDRLIFPTMIPSLEGWTKFCTYVNRCLSTEILVWPELVLCAWLVRACKHPLGFSKAESKQSEPQVHLASFCSLLLPGLSPVSLTSALCCHTTATHSLCPFPSATSPGFVLLPASKHNFCQASQLSSLKLAGANLPILPSNHVVQVSHPTFAPTLSSQPFFISTSSLLLILWVHQSRISSQIGRHQAGFIPEAANLGPMGQIWPQICLVWLHYAFWKLNYLHWKLLEFMYRFRFQVSLEKWGALETRGSSSHVASGWSWIQTSHWMGMNLQFTTVLPTP